MTAFTMDHSGTIRHTFRGPHKCGSPRLNTYGYRVEITVSGPLRGPRFFVVDWQDVDTAIVHLFDGEPGMSCELMANRICGSMRKLMKTTGYRVERIKVDMTGTKGVAWLSCEWRRS